VTGRHPAPPSLEDVRELAVRLHATQVDKAGEPYVGHLRRVADRVAAAGGSEHQRMAALLHDAVEDGHATLAELAARGLPAPVLAIVDAMTKRTGEPTEAYLGRVVATPGATLVKHADLADNSDPDRLAVLDPAVAERLRAKYAGYRAVLGDPPPGMSR
jgi:(p)ppGpp synthase/HD superfamily hydrolase